MNRDPLMTPRTLLVGLAVLGASSSVATTASAYERQYKLGLGLGIETLKLSSDTTLHGSAPGLQADVSYGVSDMFNVFAEVGATAPKMTRDAYSVRAAKEGDPATQVPETAVDGRFTMFTGHVGAAYTLDVLRWVPYAGLGVGATHIRHAEAGAAQTRLSTVIALGLDYAWSRELQLGAAVRLVAAPGTKESWTSYQGFLRVGYTWGW